MITGHDYHPGIRESRMAKEVNHRVRLAVLAQAARLTEEGHLDKVLPMLIVNYANDPKRIGRIHLIQLDEAMFGTQYITAKRWVRRMRERLHDTTKLTDGRLDLAWALDTQEHTVRMTLWLWMLAEREKLTSFRVPGGFPYSLIYDNWDPAYDEYAQTVSDDSDWDDDEPDTDGTMDDTDWEARGN